MRRLLWLGVCLTLSTLFAHEGHKGKPITVTGTVVDTGCYVKHDSKGSEHAACAAACAKNGVPLAILDNSGKLYLPSLQITRIKISSSCPISRRK